MKVVCIDDNFKHPSGINPPALPQFMEVYTVVHVNHWYREGDYYILTEFGYNWDWLSTKFAPLETADQYGRRMEEKCLEELICQ